MKKNEIIIDTINHITPNTGVDIFQHFGMDENLGGLLEYRDFKIKSWCTDIPNIKNILSKINLNNDTKIVEIGVHGGGSFLLTFDLIENKNCTLTGIDCWEKITERKINGIDNNFWSKESLEKFLSLHKKNRETLEKIVKTYDLNNQITILHGFSNEENIISQFEDNSIDLLYIDGDHSFDGCFLDLKNWFPKVKKNGYILNDDYLWDGVNRAVNLFCKEMNINNLKIEGNQSVIQKV
jgi:hypothetical protein